MKVYGQKEIRSRLRTLFEAVRILSIENSKLWAALDPGKCPCDCCELDEYNGKQYWRSDCQCGNQDDAGEARSWCDDANKFAAVSSEQEET